MNSCYETQTEGNGKGILFMLCENIQHFSFLHKNANPIAAVFHGCAHLAKRGCLCTKQARAIASKLLGQTGGFTCQRASQRDSDDEEQAKEGLITAWLAGYSCITWENMKCHLRHGVGREEGKKAADEVEETCIKS